MQANRGVTLILLSLMTSLGSPKDVLTLQPNWPLFFTGETVTLTCSGRPFKHHGFTWYRNESNSLMTKYRSQDNIYTIAPVTEAHSGVYTCAAESMSDPVRLNVSALPKATLTVEPKWRPLYNGETVTLRCEVHSYSNWIYSWYKDQAQMALSQTAGHSVTGNRLTIPGAAGTDQGQYWCEGRLEGRNVTSQRSDSITLTVAALPKATLTVEPKWHPLYNGEAVTLSCEMESYSSWTYSWYKDQAQMALSQTAGHSVTGNRLTIPGAAGSDQGQYWCEGRLEGRKVTSQRSDSTTLTVAALPKATLTVDPIWRPLYNGEAVTLSCEVESYSNWIYSWYKDQAQLAVSQTAGHRVTGNRLTIPGAAGSDQGQYWCEGRLEERNVTSQRSDSINLTVAALPKATLTVEPKWHPLYNGEAVTLRCEVESYSNWIYSWYKDQAQMAVSQTAGYSVTGNRLTIPGAAGSDQGQYWCEGRLEERKVTSQCSDSINLTVAALPQASLTVEPKWRPLYNGVTVTLRCEVDFYSNWTYFWYRDHNQTATTLSKEYSVNITGAAGSDQGQYWCEGRLEGRNVTSQHSDSITLTVADYEAQRGGTVILSIALGVGFCLIVLALIFILFQKHRRNKGLSQAAGPSCEPLHSQANVTNQKKKRKEAGGHEDVVWSVLGLQDQKSKNTPTEGCDNVVYSIVALEDQKKKKRKEKNTQRAGGCEDVVYSTVNQKRMKKNTDEAEGGNDVVYSTLALEDQKKKKKKEKNTEKAEGGNDVVYSTLALEDQKKEKRKKEKNTANGDADVLYSTVRTGQREQHWLPDPPPL